ncbi:GIY-YIG nuclease family protein [Streptomyces sp. enrichment culture]|uniref:GIY-YIG nuclease family protein n=1 Tax=Streptomyces sp. enrichment culture TaxID=1795815 RepID=UPI003F552554
MTLSQNITDRLYANALAAVPANDHDFERAAVASDTVWIQTSHVPVVYFVTNGDRVKIGTSTNITARVGALSLRRSNAVLLLQGGNDLENALHKHFDADRIGRTEWFVLSPSIRDYITRRKEAEAALRQPYLPEEAHEPPPRARPTRAVVIPSPTKKATADQKVVHALAGAAESDGAVTYLDKMQLTTLTGLAAPTLDNALSRLVKAGKIHRQMEDGRVVRGMYGPGPAPAADDAEPAE